jgi:branched-chain amino acid transport system substrate-binding protein
MIRRIGGAVLATALAGTVPSSGPASAQGAASGAFSGNALRIGVLNDQSGLYAEFGGQGSIEAAKMAVEDMGGKIDGVPIEILSADHQNKPDIASAIARQWYDRDGVDAIMELTTSSVALAVQGLSKEKKKITITTGAASSDLTGKACTPYGYHWAYDTRALAVGTGGALTRAGGDTWYFLTADYAFGSALEADTSRVVLANNGKVLGSVRHPLSNQDFSSFLLQAQGSKAKVIGLANAGLDTSNSIKQAAEYGIVEGGQKLAALLFTLSEVHGLGLKVAQGLTLTEGWYWDANDETRAFGQRYMKRTGRMPNMIQAGTYSAVLSYLKAVKAAGTDETEAVNAKLKALPVDDVFAHGGIVQPNGRMVHDMYLFEVKKPAESKGPWDLYRQLATIPGKEAYATAAESGCPLTAAAK